MKTELNSRIHMPLRALIPAERRVIRNLASALCAAMGVSQGVHLVSVIGLGGEHNNQEAMETWVSHQIALDDLVPGREALPVLLERLERLAEAWGGVW